MNWNYEVMMRCAEKESHADMQTAYSNMQKREFKMFQELKIVQHEQS